MSLKMDPLYLGSVKLDADQHVQLHSGHKILRELEALVRENRSIEDVLHSGDDVMDHFSTLFPEIVESNQVGKIQKKDFDSWEKSENNMKIELDPDPDSVGPNEGLDVYIGGPAALTGAALQATSGHNPRKILYGHNGKMGVSNWKGSASYVHIRNAVPVYYWPNNHGVYVTYASAKHFLQRTFKLEKYIQDIADNPHWNKLRFSLKQFFRDPSVLSIFVKNQIKAIQDVGLHIPGTELKTRTESTAYLTCHHSFLTYQILDELKSSVPLITKSSKQAYALSVYLGADKDIDGAVRVFDYIGEKAGDYLLRREYLTKDEIQARGYNPNFVKKAAVFTNDGFIPPYVDGAMTKLVQDNGGQVQGNLQLIKILVKPTETGDTIVTRVVWRNTESDKVSTTAVSSLYLSLGPSMQRLEVVAPEYSPLKHLQDIFSVKFGMKNSSEAKQVPSMAAFYTQIVNKMKPKNLMSKMMLAAGTSMVMMVRVDKDVVPDSKMVRFRDFSDGHNIHIVRLAEKEVVIGEKRYQYFVLQITGGGNFPSMHVHAEPGINLVKGNAIPLLGLGEEGIEFDVLQARSCARGITAQNVFRIMAPAANFVMMYGIGGIGMTTMAPNALLMKAVMGLRQELASEQISVNDFKERLTNSNFSQIPHWKEPNPFRWNYAQYTDYVNDPREIYKRLGINSVRYGRRLTPRTPNNAIPVNGGIIHTQPAYHKTLFSRHFRRYFSRLRSITK